MRAACGSIESSAPTALVPLLKNNIAIPAPTSITISVTAKATRDGTRDNRFLNLGDIFLNLLTSGLIPDTHYSAMIVPQADLY
jgi:hypothetical protein